MKKQHKKEKIGKEYILKSIIQNHSGVKNMVPRIMRTMHKCLKLLTAYIQVN